MSKVYISESKLRNIIKESIYDVLKELNVKDLNSGVFNNHGKEINVGDIIFVEDKTEILKNAPKVWNILTYSYKNIGGLKTYRDYDDFCNKHHLQMIIFNGDNVLACATYRKVENSLKMVAIGCDQTENGKLALQQIIQDNIKNFGLYYWAEVSGAIEYYFKKYNGFPMPNVIAYDILNTSPKSIILSHEDDVHYERQIAGGGIYKKMIFGIKNEKIFNDAISAIGNYAHFMEEVNNIKDDIIENNNTLRYNVKQSIFIIENIYRAHEEDGFNELVPSWNEALTESLKTLKSQKIKNDIINDYIEYAEYLLKDMQLLKLNSFNF